MGWDDPYQDDQPNDRGQAVLEAVFGVAIVVGAIAGVAALGSAIAGLLE